MNKDAVKVRLYIDIKHNVVCFFGKICDKFSGNISISSFHDQS